MGRAHVLVVDDDLEIRSMLRRVLLAEQYDVDTATTVADGVRLAIERRPDVVVMDIGLPDGDGVQAVEQLRDAGRWAPVLMLTAHGDLERRVESFRAGADDFLAKPFHVEELLVRLDALIRRGRGTSDPALDTRIRRGDLLLDLESRRCWRGAREIELSPREFDLLEYLATNAGTARRSARRSAPISSTPDRPSASRRSRKAVSGSSSEYGVRCDERMLPAMNRWVDRTGRAGPESSVWTWNSRPA